MLQNEYTYQTFMNFFSLTSFFSCQSELVEEKDKVVLKYAHRILLYFVIDRTEEHLKFCLLREKQIFLLLL